MDRTSSLLPLAKADTFKENPLLLLREAASDGSEVVIVLERGSIVSRTQNCPGVMAVFGPHGVREVLSQPDLFESSRPVAEQLGLPPLLVRLNTGLFSLRGGEHASQQKLLHSIFGMEHMKEYCSLAIEGARSRLCQIRWDDPSIPLLSTMRRLALKTSERLVFGESAPASWSVGELIYTYFESRRAVADQGHLLEPRDRDSLIELGVLTDGGIRSCLPELIATAGEERGESDPMIVRLARAAAESGAPLSVDQLTTHANMLFMASCEPVATSLTWIFLLLSQQPQLSMALRASSTLPRSTPVSRGTGNFDLADSVIHEALRLFPPNAIMVRVATRACKVRSKSIPKDGEIIISPFISHRDPLVYTAPDDFDPFRWDGAKPSPFSYFPYGAGSHHCLGRTLAHMIIRCAMSEILSRFELSLAADQNVDWRVNVTFAPSNEPIMKATSPTNARFDVGGRLLGPVSDLVRFPPFSQNSLDRTK